MNLLSATGEEMAPASLFVHVSFLREDEIVSTFNIFILLNIDFNEIL